MLPASYLPNAGSNGDNTENQEDDTFAEEGERRGAAAAKPVARMAAGGATAAAAKGPGGAEAPAVPRTKTFGKGAERSLMA